MAPMASHPVITSASGVTLAWLSQVLQQPVAQFTVSEGDGDWSRQIAIQATLHSGSTQALRLKLCLGQTFGRSEVDYYTQDYVDMADAPLVRCFDAQYDAAVGYHLLLQDLASTHSHRHDTPPTLAYGLAVAGALGRLHRHHWGRTPGPGAAALDRYFDEVRPGVSPLGQATGQPLRQRFEAHEQAFRQRCAQAHGMTLLHGDLNPGNVLTPRGADAPVYFLDRQPFDWSLTTGLAVSDLAYFMVPWWPEQTFRACAHSVLWHWHQCLQRPNYSWASAQADWALAVEQCLHVPMEWCSKADTLHRMRWLWQAQFARVRSALAV